MDTTIVVARHCDGEVKVRRYYALPHFLYDFLALRRNLRIKPSKLVSIQEKKLKAIVRYAYNYVPFYHRLFEANGLKPSDIKTIDDLKKIPIITRKGVQENFDSMLSQKIDVQKCAKKKTSGSSGVPLMVIEDNYTSNFKAAVSLRQFLECGGRLRDKQVQLREPGASSLPTYSKKPFYESLGLLRTEWIETGEIFDKLIPFLKTYKPDVMVGYPGFLQLLAEKSGEEIRSRIVFATGEILSNHCRRVLNSAFGARVIDSYGCTETGDIAWECPEGHQGYHMNVDSVIVEFIRDGENVAAGEEGEVVLTNLFNYSMPLIRYGIRDIGVPSSELCACGRTLPLMHLIEGRSDDFIVLPDGRKLSPLGMVNIQDFVGVGVSEIKIVQEAKNLVDVWLEVRDGYDADSVNRCISTLREIMGKDIDVRTHLVSVIPRNGSAKLRRVISKVASSQA